MHPKKIEMEVILTNKKEYTILSCGELDKGVQSRDLFECQFH